MADSDEYDSYDYIFKGERRLLPAVTGCCRPGGGAGRGVPTAGQGRGWGWGGLRVSEPPYKAVGVCFCALFVSREEFCRYISVFVSVLYS